MRTSTERILTTHVGSLPRAEMLTEFLIRQQAGEMVDERALSEAIERGVAAVVRHQVDAGLDIVNDGEQSKPGFQPMSRSACPDSAENPSGRSPATIAAFRVMRVFGRRDFHAEPNRITHLKL